VEKARKINERGKQFLYRELESLNIEYVKTEANFIYILLPDDIVPELHQELLKEGVIVRPMGHREMRITIGLSRENRRLVEVLKRKLVHIRK
jgi:histidinol-phosphate aminotransferase